MNARTRKPEKAQAASQTESRLLDVDKLVNGPTLLQILFDDETRPTLRWLQYQQQKKRVPFIKISRLVFFDPEKVRESLNAQKTAKYGVAA